MNLRQQQYVMLVYTLETRKKVWCFYVFIWKVSEDLFEPPPPLILPSHLLRTCLRNRGSGTQLSYLHGNTPPLGSLWSFLLCLSLGTKSLNIRGRQQSVMIKHKRDKKIICETHSWWHHCHFPVRPVPRGACLYSTASGSLQHCGLSIGGLPLTVNGLFVGEQWAISAPTESPG